MTDLDHYLCQHFLNETELASAAAIGIGELDSLIALRSIPEPSYVVSERGTVCSFVFGDMAAPGARPGRFFPPAQLGWIALARQADGREARLKEQFSARFGAALATLNLSTWRLRDSFSDDGMPLADGIRQRCESAWKYFLNGTFGLCVANPMSEAHIACKEVLQEKLSHLSDNGSRTAFTPPEVTSLRALVDAYAAASMPFSPLEYASSSRKRLVDDLRARLV